MERSLNLLPEVCANSREYIDGCAVVDGDWLNAFIDDTKTAINAKGAACKRKVIAAALRLIGNMWFGSRAAKIINTRHIESLERNAQKFSTNGNGED